MAIKNITHIQNFQGTSTERAAMSTTNIPKGSTFEEENTNLLYKWTGSTWFLSNISKLLDIANESRGYDDTNDSLKVINHGSSYKLIELDDITGIADGGDGDTDWLNDDDIARAKAITLYYTSNRTHTLQTKYDPYNPAVIGYFGSFTIGEFHSGTQGSLTGISQKVSFKINDINIFFNFINNDGGGNTMNITNIVVKLQF